MIVDHRTYNIKPGQLNAYLKLYEPRRCRCSSSISGTASGGMSATTSVH